MKKIIIVGLFSEIVELCEKCKFDIMGYVDLHNQNTIYDYIGDDDYFFSMKDEYSGVPVFLSPDAPDIRKKLYSLYTDNRFNVVSLISPNSNISKSAVIGEGCMIQDACNVSSNVSIGKLVRLNTGSIVMHDTVIEDFCTIAPGVVILGKCRIEEGAYIGANSTILPGVTVCKGAVVGAGAVVTKDVESNMTVIGIPAREMHEYLSLLKGE